MSSVRSRLWGLCFPPFLLSVCDGAVTLWGQSAEYWRGNYAAVNEISPTFHQLLRLHPVAFGIGVMVWAAVFVGILLLLPDTLALIVSIAVTFGHTAGTATWLMYRFQYGYQAANGLFLLTAVLLGLCIRWGWRAAPAEDYQLSSWSPLVRWILSALLFGVGVYLFLWPRHS